MFNILTKFFIAGGFLTSAYVVAADGVESAPIPAAVEVHSEQDLTKISWDQRKSMFLYGTIPVNDVHGKHMGTFEVRYLPGAANVVEDAKTYMTTAIESLKPYIQAEEFWMDDIWGAIKDCGRYAKDVHCDAGAGQLPEDFAKFREKCKCIDRRSLLGFGNLC